MSFLDVVSLVKCANLCSRYVFCQRHEFDSQPRVFSRFLHRWHHQTSNPTLITSVTIPRSAPMNGNPPSLPPVKLVRAYTPLPKLTILTIESIHAKGTSSTSNSPVAPSP